ncbi:MAG: type II secretion system protein GspM [Pseudomonadota bacterium]
MNQLRTWWTGLSERDRRILLLGAALALPLLAYALIWQPLDKAREEARQAHADAAAQLNEVRQLSAQLVTRRGAHPAGGTPQIGSPLAAVEAAAREQGLPDALKRREADGNQGVRLFLEDAPADAVMRMLEHLALVHALHVEQAQFDAAAPGKVNANITLQRGKP